MKDEFQEIFEIEMDNQQRSLENRLYWLGGLFDGEGSIVLSKRQERKDFISYRPGLFITNTDEIIIESACDVLSDYKLPFYVYKSKSYNTKHKPKIDIMISGFQRCIKVLPVIIPVLVSKKYRAQLLFDYCNRRLSMPKSSQLTEIDLLYVQRLRDANNRGQVSKPLRDYTPDVIVK